MPSRRDDRRRRASSRHGLARAPGAGEAQRPGRVHCPLDGYRIIGRRDGDAVRLWTRLQNERGGSFVGVAAALRAMPVTSSTIDGEAVILRPDGHSDFRAPRSRAGAAAATLIAFDLLELAGDDLRRQPLEDRRARLAALLVGAEPALVSASPSTPRAPTSSPRPAPSASKASSPSAAARPTAPAGTATGSRSPIPAYARA